MVTFNTYVEFQQNSVGEKSKWKKERAFISLETSISNVMTFIYRRLPSASLPKISSTSFQNNFHLFLAVFVCYRSAGHIFSVEENSPPNWSCIPKQIDSLTAPHVVVGALSNLMTNLESNDWMFKKKCNASTVKTIKWDLTAKS